ERKCGLIITFNTILATAIVGLLSFFTDSLFHPDSLLDKSILIIAVLSVIALIFSWWHALLSIKFGVFKAASSSDDSFSYMMKELDNEKMYQHMFNCYTKPIKSNCLIIKQKADYLRDSYGELVVGGFLLTLLLSLTFIREILK
ncbi:MAG: hypothetical protein ACI9N9_001090, partial [Enterobacterales bacterium]